MKVAGYRKPPRLPSGLVLKPEGPHVEAVRRRQANPVNGIDTQPIVVSGNDGHLQAPVTASPVVHVMEDALGESVSSVKQIP
jgi:hypothetical protein